MREGWVRRQLGEVCTLRNGRAYKKPELLDKGKYRVLRVGNFFTSNHWYYSDLELEDTKYCDLGDLLYAWSASFGPRIWEGEKVIYHYHIWRVDFDAKKIEKKFLYYWFMWDAESIKKDQGAGTTMVHVSMKSMNARLIDIPPLDEQKRIVAILDEAFAGIDAAIANTEKNLANARELFESYLSSVFTRREDEWEVKKLGEIAEFKNGLNFNKHSDGQTLPVIGVGDFQKNQYVPIKNLELATIDGTLDPTYKVKKDDILTVRSNGSKDLIGRCMLVPEVKEQTSFSGFVIRIRFDTTRIVPKFLLWFMKSNATVKQLTREGGGANINNINQKKLSALLVTYPSSSGEQLEIAQKLDELLLELERLESIYQQKLNSLIELKQSLLQKAFSGELTAESDKFMEEAVA
ncbi:MAG: restriction endonuclease subunit S [Candidatus Thiodiazotropha sp. (ex Monitilora ramsayi)]|nr:restriction endonuclease subunit S [Candidatus Thiodiazotropha sp. (ex Monitilora ramsayi)]